MIHGFIEVHLNCAAYRHRAKYLYKKWSLCIHLEINTCKYNIGQNIVDKSTKLSNIGFFIECFTTHFSQFCSITVKICL